MTAKTIRIVRRSELNRRKTIHFNFGEPHKEYIRRCRKCTYNILEGAVRSGKTIDNVFAFSYELKRTPDKIHLASGSTLGNAKMNIGDANGFGLEWIFRGQCRWGKYKGMEALVIQGPDTNFQQRIVIFSGAFKSDSFKAIRGNSYGMWIATEINLHHDTFIKEAFNRQLAAKKRKIFWDLNPEPPKAPIYTNYLDVYAAKAEAGSLLGGYNYRHFDIFQNINIPSWRLEEIISQYDENSVWYARDILGKRTVAEGLIYRKFADSPEAFTKPADVEHLDRIIVGVDFGGNGSGHSFVATGIYKDGTVHGLMSRRHMNADYPQGIDANILSELFIAFLDAVVTTYGMPDHAYWDNAETVLGQTIRNACRERYPRIRVMPALKRRIKDRIDHTVRLMGKGQFWLTEHCETLSRAFQDAVWNPKTYADERLDDGTSDIDSLDAFEYTIEREINRMKLKTFKGGI